MITSTVKLNQSELELFMTIQELQYGEIHEIELREGDEDIPFELTRQSRDLLAQIRKGTRYFELIQVHQSEPTYAQAPMLSRGGLKCKKRYKFN